MTVTTVLKYKIEIGVSFISDCYVKKATVGNLNFVKCLENLMHKLCIV